MIHLRRTAFYLHRITIQMTKMLLQKSGESRPSSILEVGKLPRTKCSTRLNASAHASANENPNAVVVATMVTFAERFDAASMNCPGDWRGDSSRGWAYSNRHSAPCSMSNSVDALILGYNCVSACADWGQSGCERFFTSHV